MDMESSQDKKKLKETREEEDNETNNRPLRMLILTGAIVIIVISMAIGLLVHFIVKEKGELSTPFSSNITASSTWVASMSTPHHIFATTTTVPTSGALLNCTGDEDLPELRHIDSLLDKLVFKNNRNLVDDSYQENCRYYFYLSNHIKKENEVNYLTADAKCRSEEARLVSFQSHFEACRIVRKILSLEKEQLANQRLLPHDLIDFPKSLWIEQEIGANDVFRQVRNDLLCPGEIAALLSRGYFAALDFSKTHACVKVVPRNGNRQFVCKKCFK